MKLFEYMASERPIVATDLPSIMEIVNEDTALICNPDDAASMAAAIQQVFDDPLHAARLAKRACQKSKNFTWRAQPHEFSRLSIRSKTASCIWGPMVDETMSSSLEHIALDLNPKRTYIIGEVGQSHDGSLGMAHALIDIIADAGCDAVKFQTHIAAAETTLDEPWRVDFSRQDANRYEYWARMEFNEDQWTGLATHAKSRGLDFLSSPFSVQAVELLDRVGVKWWKIASGEVFNPELLAAIWATGRPVVYSTGLIKEDELDCLVEQQRRVGTPFALMQCTSEYPAPPERWGLQMIADLRARYDVPVGLSDHSGSVFAGLAAAALKADLLEVHVTFSREMFGPDVSASLTPSELNMLVDGARAIRTSLAADYSKDKAVTDAEAVRRTFTRSWALREPLPAGTVLERQHLTLKKPGTGLSPCSLATIIGRSLCNPTPADRLLTMEDLY